MASSAAPGDDARAGAVSGGAAFSRVVLKLSGEALMGDEPYGIDPERIYDMLLSARTAEVCTVHFKDGRIMRGAMVFNQFKGTGRLINVDDEVSVDFSVDDVRDLKF